MIRAFVFDLDGTIVQTERLKAKSYAQAIADLCPHAVSEEEAMAAYAEVVGRPRYEVANYLVDRFDLAEKASARLEELGVDTPWQALVQVRMGYFDAMIGDPALLRQMQWPHNVALLKHAQQMGCRVALATMSSKERVQFILDAIGLEDAFDLVVTGDDVSHGKPDPEIYLLVADTLEFKPCELLVIEDSVSGIQSAVLAGTHCVAVTTRFSRAAVREQEYLPPSAIVDDPRELVHAIMEIYDAERETEAPTVTIAGPAARPVGPFPTVDARLVPWIDVGKLVEADKVGPEQFGISVLQMMEHAGAAIADAVAELAPPGGVVVLAGGGNNGAGGLCAARHISARGRYVEVVLVSDHLSEAGRHHLETLEKMGIQPRDASSEHVVIDAMVGYGLRGSLEGRAAEFAEWARGRWTASLDFPSGYGATGAVRPDVTVTLGLPKRGLEGVEGTLLLADIGLPEQLWRSIGVDSGRPFARGRLVELVAREELFPEQAQEEVAAV